MTDQLELERQMMLEAFKSDFVRLSIKDRGDEPTNPVFDQINKNKLLDEIKHPLFGEIWDDIKRLIALSEQAQTNDDLKKLVLKSKEILGKIKVVKNSIDNTEEGEYFGMLHASEPVDPAQKRNHEANHTILGWFYNLAGPMIHAYDAYQDDIDAFRFEIVSGIKKEIE